MGLAPPVLTAKAWCIAQGDDGTVLWSSKGEEQREIASMSKMVTFLVILKEIESKMEILDEAVEVVEESAKMTGTTADLRQGDVLTVKDLLYGMMLPSGNDAAHALSIYFGGIMKEDGVFHHSQNPVTLKYKRFIREMN